MRCCGSARRRIWRASIGSSRSTGAWPIRAACRTPRRRSSPPRASRSTCSTRRFTRPKSRTARRSSHIVHRLATENSPFVREILDNSVVLLVPSQNPDGQHLVIDHWYKTKGTALNRVYPDLYHKYVGHDDNRDWFMFTQKETRMNIELVQNKFKPIITHDMHQQGADRLAHLRAAVHRSVRREHPPDPGARTGDGRAGDGDGAARGGQGRRRVERVVRHVDAGAAVHGLSRPAAHPHRDRQRQPRRSVRQSAEGTADRPAGVALELPRAVFEGHVDAAAAGGLRRDGGARRHLARREVRPRVALQLLSRASRLGELRQGPVSRSSSRPRSAIRSRPTRCSRS